MKRMLNGPPAVVLPPAGRDTSAAEAVLGAKLFPSVAAATLAATVLRTSLRVISIEDSLFFFLFSMVLPHSDKRAADLTNTTACKVKHGKVDSAIHFAHYFAVLKLATTKSFRWVKKVITDADGFDDALSGTQLNVDILSGKFIPTSIERFQSANWSIDLGEIHVKARARAPLPKGWGSVGFIGGSGSSIWHGMKTESGALVCNPPGGDGPDGQVMPGFAWSAFGVPAGLWERCQALAGAEIKGAFSQVVRWQLPASLFLSLHHQLYETHRLLQSALKKPHLSCFAERAAVKLVTNITTHAFEASLRDQPVADSLRNRVRLARSAETWMRDRLCEPFNIADLCVAHRVSRREMEYAFRGTFNTSPQKFLSLLRLNAIHRALVRADESSKITAIAFDHGITHLGRFAASYR